MLISILHTSKQVTSRSHTAPVPHGWHWHRPEGAQEMGEFTPTPTSWHTKLWKLWNIKLGRSVAWIVRKVMNGYERSPFSLTSWNSRWIWHWEDEIQDEHEKQTKYDEHHETHSAKEQSHRPHRNRDGRRGASTSEHNSCGMWASSLIHRFHGYP